MSTTTQNLELFKYNPDTDGKQTFNIDNALNQNWDKIDVFSQNLKSNIDNINNNMLVKSQVTNCILDAPNGVATYIDSTITIKQGLKVIIPNGYNENGSLKNIEYTCLADINHTFEESDNYSGEIYLTSTDTISLTNGAAIGKINIKNGVIISLQTYKSLELAKIQDIDGKFYYVGKTIATNVNLYGSTDLIYDLSEYLPNDNEFYECLFIGAVHGAGDIGDYSELYIGSEFYKTPLWVARCRTTASALGVASGCISMLIGPERRISIRRTTISKGTFQVILISYRKVR